MLFQLLRRGTKKKSPSLHTITVIESPRIGFLLGPLLAQVTSRSFFDLRTVSGKPPRVSNKVVSVLAIPSGAAKAWGCSIDVEDLIKSEAQVTSQSVLRLAMLRLRDLSDPWN